MIELNEMPADFVKTFGRHLRIYELLGLHIFDNNEKGKYQKHLRFVGVSIFFTVMTLSQILFVSCGGRNGADLLEIILAFPCGVVFSIDLIKMYILAAKKSQISKLLTEMAELWPVDLTNDSVKKHEMSKRIKRGRTFDNILLYGTAMALFVFHTVPIAKTLNNWVNSEYIFLTSHHMYLPWSVNSLARYIVSDGLFVTFGCSIYIGIGLTSELFLVALVNNLSVLFKLLHIELEQVVPSHEENTVLDGKSDTEKLEEIIRTHQKLLRLSEKINNIFGIIIFATTSTSAVLICFFGFLTVISKGTDVFVYIMGLFGMVTSILNFSWPGQLLYDTSSGIAYAAYSCLWYKKDPEFRKLVLLIIHRSHKPSYLSALGISNMSYQTLVTVFNTSLSYLSLLRQMYAQEQLM